MSLRTGSAILVLIAVALALGIVWLGLSTLPEKQPPAKARLVRTR